MYCTVYSMFVPLDLVFILLCPSLYTRWPDLWGFHLSSINGRLWWEREVGYSFSLLLAFQSTLWSLLHSSPQAIASAWVPLPRKQPSLGCSKCPFLSPSRPMAGDHSPLLLGPRGIIIFLFLLPTLL